jgi:O-antigen ligase
MSPAAPARLWSAGRQMVGLVVYGLFLASILLSPLPMGANRDWAWAPMVVAVGAFGLCCAAGFAGTEALVVSDNERTALLVLAACFLFFLVVVLLQMSPLAPATASAWYYAKAAQLLRTTGQAVVPSLAVDASRDALLKCIACATIFLVARVLFRDHVWARLLLLVVGLSAAIEVSYAIYAEATTRSCYLGSYLKKQGSFEAWNDHCLMSGTFVGSNSFGCFVGMALVAVLALLFDRRQSFRHSRHRDDEFDEPGEGLAVWMSGRKLALLALALYLLGGTLFSASRAGVASTFVCVVALGYLLARGAVSWRTARTAIAGIMVGIAILGIAGGAFFTKMSGLLNTGNLNRVVIWRQSIGMIAESPWLGWGLGSYADVYAIHQPVSIPQPNDKAHSTPLELAVELGVPGALAAIASGVLPLGVCLFGALRRRRRRYLPAAAFAVSGVAMLHSTVDFSLQIPAIAFVVSALLGLGWAQAFGQSEPVLRRTFASEA